MKRSKSGGEILRIEDRISDLPDVLLLEILSFLPAENAIATSVLSKRWRSLWKMLPHLNFFYYGTPDNDLEIFSDNVYRCLLSHQAPVLQSLHISVSFDEGHAIDLGRLVGIAFGLRVRNLVLESFCSRGSFRFPRSLFNGETLETLEFRAFCGTILVDVPSPVCLKSLRTLQLHQVVYKNDESVLNLLSGCINLENLVVNRKRYDNVKTFTIAVPSLQRLTLKDECYDLVYKVNAPSLKYVKFIWIGGRGSCFIENTPMLLEASIIINDLTSFILGSLTSVKRLSLEISSFEEIKPQPWEKSIYGVPLGKWNQPNNVPQCSLCHLKTFVWKGYEWRENEKEVTKYILSNASRLEKATFFRKRLTSKERDTMVEVLEELETVIKASSSCQLLFK